MEQQMEKLPTHVLVFPLPFQGPMNSMFKLAELLCLSGLQITFLVTEHIHGRLQRSIDDPSLLTSYPGLQIKAIPDGLPVDHPRSGAKFGDVIESINSTAQPLLKEMLTSGCLGSSSQVTCIIADGVLGFTCDVAREIGISIFYVRTLSPCSLWVFFSLPNLIETQELPFKGDDLDVLIQNVPGTEKFLRRRDLPSFCRLGNLSEYDSLELLIKERQENPRADGLILNTFEELEQPILSHIRSVCPNLYTIGPFHAHVKTKKSKKKSLPVTTSSSLWKQDRSCITWLGAQPPKSVIYVSFGSITILTEEQLMEFWHGLVNSGVKFLWVIRPDLIAGKDWEKQIPVDLSEGTKEMGHIVGWAPQEEVLAHPAVGGFLTHSGWNSTLESIYAGVPMICWPYFVDQQVNSRFVSEVWKLGLDMKDTCDRGVVENMIRELMEIRKDEFLQKADEMSKLVRSSLSEGGASYCNLDRLIKDIEFMNSKRLTMNE